MQILKGFQTLFQEREDMGRPRPQTLQKKGSAAPSGGRESKTHADPRPLVAYLLIAVALVFYVGISWAMGWGVFR